MDDESELMAFIRAIAAHDHPRVRRLLAEQTSLASTQVARGATRQTATEYFLVDIEHHVYRGDTALHIAAAAHEPTVVGDLAAAGAAVDLGNRRGGRPLHYAVDGGPGAARWNPGAQRDTVAALIQLGANVDATDKNGTTPLLRAIRNRSASAVRALLEGGADPTATNTNGSTARELATWTTGKGGSGSPEAKAQQEEILELLRERE